MKTPLSPKTLWAVLGGLFASALVSNLQYITPDLFHFLGGWGPFGYGVVVAVLAGAASYVKRDLLRDVGAETVARETAAQVATPYNAETPYGRHADGAGAP